MLKTFPTSKVFSNSTGAIFTRRELEELSKELLKRFKAYSPDIGLELSFCLLWALDRATTVDELRRLAAGALWSRLRNGWKSRPYLRELPQIYSEDQIELNFEDQKLLLMQLRKFLKENPKEEVELQDPSAVKRHRAIKKLKEKWENLQ